VTGKNRDPGITEELQAKCNAENQFDDFDRAFRKTLTVSKPAFLKEEARLKRARAKKRAKKTAIG
jgi:hypothetical protein